MEKSRTLLAILLATAVLILWDHFFLKPVRGPVPPRQAGESGVAPESAAVAEQVPPSKRQEVHPAGAGTADLDVVQLRAPVSAGEARPETIRVETDLWEAEFGTLGGNLLAWRLKRFDDRDGEEVQLVKAAAGELGVKVAMDHGGIDFTRGLFEYRREWSRSGRRVERLSFVCRDSSGVTLRKDYRFGEDSYRFRLEVSVSGGGGKARVGAYELEWSSGLPVTENDPKADERHFATIGMVGSDKIADKIGSFKKHPVKGYEGNVRWGAVRNMYFIAAVVSEEGSVTELRTFGSPEDSTTGFALVMPAVPGAVTKHSFGVYIGPMDYWQLKALGVGLEQTVDLGFKFIRPLSKVLLRFMVFCYGLIPNYGVVIILMALLTKVIFFPLTRISVRSTREMQKLQPEMAELRKKYAKDPQRLNKETLGLYKKHKVNPAAGCLPLLIQMPVFFALYSVLRSSIEIRHAPFFGWISDLSAAETVASIGSFPIHLLPLLMTVVSFVQQKLTPSDPKQKNLMAMMPIMMLVIFYGLPSGLVLYWTVNSAFTLVEHLMAGKHKTPEPAGEPQAAEAV